MSLLTGSIDYYKFDENTSTNVGDSAGSNNGTWQGTLGSQWTTGIIRSGGNFNGTDNLVGILAALLDVTTTLSISFWINGAAQNDNKMFCEGNSGSANQVWNLGSGTVTTSKLRLFLRNDANTQIASIESTTSILTSSWNHVVFTDNNGTANVYINGLLDATSFNYTPSGTFTFNQTSFGVEHRNSYGGYFSGKIDEIGIWNRVLSPAEVLQVYNNGLGLQYPFTTNPVYVSSSLMQPVITQRVVMF